MANPIKQAIKNTLKGLSITLSNGAQLLNRGYNGDFKTFFTENIYSDSDAGISVTKEKALNYTAFWSCVTLLAGTIASLPFHLKQNTGDRNTINAVNHPLYKLLHDEPNPEMDSFSYMETLMYHLGAANGNAYSFIDWDSDRTTIKALWPMDPDRVTKVRGGNNEIVYLYQSDGGQFLLPAYRVWHIPGFGYDGLIGYTPLTHARNLIGSALAAEKMGTKIFTNGLTFGGFLKSSKILTQDARDNLKKSIKEGHEGVEKAQRLYILEDGLSYEKNNISPEDAQMLDTEKHLYTRMAGFFHIPPHMIGDLERATFSNIEEQNIYFGVHSIRPWCVRIERSGNRQLLIDSEKDSYFMKLLIDGLLRGNTESRFRSYAIARNWGWMSANDVLELEDRNGIGEQGDIYMAPSNMVPADKFNQMMPAAAPSNQPANSKDELILPRPVF